MAVNVCFVLKPKKDQCAAKNRQTMLIINKDVDVRQPMSSAAGERQCLQSAVHGMQAARN